MSKKTGFLIILGLIILYSALSYADIPFMGLISLAIIIAIAVITMKAFKNNK